MPTTPARQLASKLGPFGLWTQHFDRLPARRVAEVVAAVERAGVPAIWFGEGPRSKEAMGHASFVLASTENLVVATGVANIWLRHAVAMASGVRLLNDVYPGRFVLGVGVSHALSIEPLGYDQSDYVRPLQRMRDYLDRMDAADLAAPAPDAAPPRLLAALRPRMLRLAAERALGAHPFFVTPEHTARAREILGPGPVLAPEQAVILETDAARARAVAREYAAHRFERETYRGLMPGLGFTEEDMEHGGSDRIIDAFVAWGDVDTVMKRLDEHRAAGADHVAVNILSHGADFPLDDLERLAPALVGDRTTTGPPP